MHDVFDRLSGTVRERADQPVFVLFGGTGRSGAFASGRPALSGPAAERGGASGRTAERHDRGAWRDPCARYVDTTRFGLVPRQLSERAQTAGRVRRARSPAVVGGLRPARA